jgi:uncharacterized membrane protein YdbT with pleckstrin-like domain
MKEQNYGPRAFAYYLVENSMLSLVLFLVMVIVSTQREQILLFLPLEKMNMSVDSVSGILNYVVGGLFILVALTICFGIFMSWIQHISHSFVMDEDAIKIRVGILDKKEVTIPYRQIQTVNTVRPLFFRLMGVSKITIFSAGNDYDDREGEAEGVFDIVDAKVAEYVQAELLKRSSKDFSAETIKEALDGYNEDKVGGTDRQVS